MVYHQVISKASSSGNDLNKSFSYEQIIRITPQYLAAAVAYQAKLHTSCVGDIDLKVITLENLNS